MLLGDGFSRNPKHRDALKAALEARNGDLAQMKLVIKGFDVNEHESCEPWDFVSFGCRPRGLRTLGAVARWLTAMGLWTMGLMRACT